MTIITEGNYAEEALLAMKSRPPNDDGTIGYTIRSDSPEWNAWQAYFIGKRMDNRAAFMRTRARDGYMVPSRTPNEFDPAGVSQARQEYAGRVHNGDVGTGEISRSSREIPTAERAEIADAVKGLVKHFGQTRSRSKDMRDAPPVAAVIKPRPMTEAERESARRLLGIEQKDAAE